VVTVIPVPLRTMGGCWPAEGVPRVVGAILSVEAVHKRENEEEGQRKSHGFG